MSNTLSVVVTESIENIFRVYVCPTISTYIQQYYGVNISSQELERCLSMTPTSGVPTPGRAMPSASGAAGYLPGAEAKTTKKTQRAKQSKSGRTCIYEIKSRTGPNKICSKAVAVSEDGTEWDYCSTCMNKTSVYRDVYQLDANPLKSNVAVANPSGYPTQPHNPNVQNEQITVEDLQNGYLLEKRYNFYIEPLDDGRGLVHGVFNRSSQELRVLTHDEESVALGMNLTVSEGAKPQGPPPPQQYQMTQQHQMPQPPQQHQMPQPPQQHQMPPPQHQMPPPQHQMPPPQQYQMTQQHQMPPPQQQHQMPPPPQQQHQMPPPPQQQHQMPPPQQRIQPPQHQMPPPPQQQHQMPPPPQQQHQMPPPPQQQHQMPPPLQQQHQMPPPPQQRIQPPQHQMPPPPQRQTPPQQQTTPQHQMPSPPQEQTLQQHEESNDQYPRLPSNSPSVNQNVEILA